jgi:hypothetical protein
MFPQAKSISVSAFPITRSPDVPISRFFCRPPPPWSSQCLKDLANTSQFGVGLSISDHGDDPITRDHGDSSWPSPGIQLGFQSAYTIPPRRCSCGTGTPACADRGAQAPPPASSLCALWGDKPSRINTCYFTFHSLSIGLKYTLAARPLAVIAACFWWKSGHSWPRQGEF